MYRKGQDQFEAIKEMGDNAAQVKGQKAAEGHEMVGLFSPPVVARACPVICE